MKKKLLILCLLTITKFIYSQSASIDPTFIIGNGLNQNSSVRTIFVQKDNKILISGANFSSINGTSLTSGTVRLNPNGSIDISFPNGTPSAYSFAQQSDGKIIIAGDASPNYNRIRRYNLDGTLDNSFSVGISVNSGFDNTIFKTSIQTDGKIIVQGSFSKFGSTTIKQLTRLNSNGSLDNNFNDNINAISAITQTNGVRSFTLLSNGKILVSTESTPRIIMLNNDGTLDSNFSTSVTNLVDSMTEQTDNKILLATTYGSNNGKLLRLNSNGSTDNSFTFYDISNGRVGEIVQTSNDNIYISNFNGATATNRLVKLSINGNVSTSFDIGTGFDDDLTKILVQSDGKILVGGYFDTYNGITKRSILRLIGDNNLSTNDNEINKVTIYPNPVVDRINISKAINTDNVKFEIYNLLGQNLLNGNVDNSSINVTSLTKGVYILKIKNGEDTINHKFIKE